jgi:hypothetical protein
MIADEIVEKFFPGSTSNRELFPVAAKRDRLNAELLHFGFADLWPDDDIVAALNSMRRSCMSAAEEAILVRLVAEYGENESGRNSPNCAPNCAM